MPKQAQSQVSRTAIKCQSVANILRYFLGYPGIPLQ